MTKDWFFFFFFWKAHILLWWIPVWFSSRCDHSPFAFSIPVWSCNLSPLRNTMSLGKPVYLWSDCLGARHSHWAICSLSSDQAFPRAAGWESEKPPFQTYCLQERRQLCNWSQSTGVLNFFYHDPGTFTRVTFNFRSCYLHCSLWTWNKPELLQ